MKKLIVAIMLILMLLTTASHCPEHKEDTTRKNFEGGCTPPAVMWFPPAGGRVLSVKTCNGVTYYQIREHTTAWWPIEGWVEKGKGGKCRVGDNWSIGSGC